MADSGPWTKYQSSAPAGPWSKYASPSPEKTSDAAPQRDPIAEANAAASASEHGPVQDIIDMGKGALSGAGSTLTGLADTATGLVTHPLDTNRAIGGKIIDLLGKGASAVAHPIDTVKAGVQYVKDLTPQKVGEMAGSTLVGGAAGKAAGVLGDVAGPAVKELVGAKPVSPTIRDLAAKGVVTTPGMRAGKFGQGLEERIAGTPFVGDSIKRARGKATEQWNRAELNEAIKDAGGKELPKTRTGRDAIFHTETEMKRAYDRVNRKMVGDLDAPNPAGVTLRQSLQQTKTLATQGLEPSAARTVNKIIDDQVIGKFTGPGKASGETIKEIEETLRTEADLHRRGGYQDRKVAQALDQVQSDFSSMLKHVNPQHALEKEGVDRGYAKFKTASRASRYSKKNEGTYTPAQKLRAIEARDRSKDKQRFASGTAHGQKQTEAIEAVMGNTIPDSGTAGRLAAMEAVTGGVGLAAGHPLAALGVAGAPLAYSQPVLRALQNRALKRGGAYTPISGTKAATVGAILGAKDQ